MSESTELEDALLAAAAEDDNDDALHVYGDLLLERDDPRGRLSLVDRQLAKQRTGARGRKLRAERAALLADFDDDLIGPLAGTEHVTARCQFHLGFARELHLSGTGPADDVVRELGEILAHPSATLVQDLVLGSFVDERDELFALTTLVEVLVAANLPALRRLVLGWPSDGEWPAGCSIAPIFERFGRLRELTVSADSALVVSQVPDSLTALSLHASGLRRANVACAVSARSLSRLELFLHDTDMKPAELIGTLRDPPESLEHVELRACEFANDVADSLGESIVSVSLAGRFTGTEQIQRLLRTGDVDDIRAALSYAEAFGFRHYQKRAIIKLIAALERDGNVEDAIEWQEVLVERWPGTQQLITLTHNYSLTGRTHEAEELIEEALESVEPGADWDRLRLELARARLFLGVAEVRVCEELAESPHLRDASRVWDILGNCYRRDGSPEKALTAFEQALARASGAGRATHEANIAQVKGLLGDQASADAGLLEAVEKARRSNDRPKLAAALAGLGQSMANSGRAIAARSYVEEAIELYRSMGHSGAAGGSLLNLGQSYAGAGDHDRARALYEEAESALREAGSMPHVATAIVYQAQVAKEKGDLDAATELGTRAKKIAEDVDCCWSMGTANVLLGDIRLHQRNLDRARESYETGGRASKRINNHRWYAWTRARLARVAYADGSWDEARELNAEALGILEKIGDDQMLGSIKTTAAVIEFASGDGDPTPHFAAAREHYERCGIAPDLARHELAVAFVDSGGKIDGDDPFSQWLAMGIEARELED